MNAKIDVSGIFLMGERVVLRPWEWSDLDDFYTYASVDGVGQPAGWTPHKSIDESRAILSHFIKDKRVFCIEYGGRAVGSLGVEEYDEGRFPELRDVKARSIGFALAKDLWGRGLMPEAAALALRWLFERQGLDAVLCERFIENERSKRVQEKLGFRQYALAGCKNALGEPATEVVSILTREDWGKR